MIDGLCEQLAAGEHLTVDQMSGLMDQVMQGACSEPQIERLLTLLHEQGETVAEVAGAAMALRRHMTPIPTDRTDLLDTCGTGGDHSGTFNISTAAALVTAAAGIPIAKHGNRGMTSKSGSADVLAALGVNIEADIDTVGRCLDTVGIGFCFAPLLHPSMRHVAPVRKRVPFPTIFNLLGPLCNPASAGRQLLGVGNPRLLHLLSAALELLGAERALVVHGSDGLDEVTISGPTQGRLVQPDGCRPLEIRPADFGLDTGELKPLRVDGPAESAEMIRQVLSGHAGPPRDIVVANTATALWVADSAATMSPPTMRQCADRAREAIDSGAARQKLRVLVEASQA